jgi:hypothetical protein
MGFGCMERCKNRIRPAGGESVAASRTAMRAMPSCGRVSVITTTRREAATSLIAWNAL